MKNVAIIGAGQMGTGITQYLAMHNIDVTLIDYKECNVERAASTIEGRLNKMVLKEKISVTEKNEIESKISYTTNMNCCERMDLVIEAIPEEIGKKEKLFIELSEIMPLKSILATNTSSISITKLGSLFYNPSNVIGLHFFNPAVVMPLVEVIRGLDTSIDTANRVTEFIERINKSPVFVQDQSGFIVNRILIPMINEAIFVLQEGIASAEEIDKAMKIGSNHPMGPLELADFIGLDTCLSIMETLHKDFGEDKYRPAPLLRRYVNGKRLGRKNKRGFYTY